VDPKEKKQACEGQYRAADQEQVGSKGRWVRELLRRGRLDVVPWGDDGALTELGSRLRFCRGRVVCDWRRCLSPTCGARYPSSDQGGGNSLLLRHFDASVCDRRQREPDYLRRRIGRFDRRICPRSFGVGIRFWVLRVCWLGWLFAGPAESEEEGGLASAECDGAEDPQASRIQVKD